MEIHGNPQHFPRLAKVSGEPIHPSMKSIRPCPARFARWPCFWLRDQGDPEETADWCFGT